MSVLAVGSVTGAPGATTLAVGLAASWPGSVLVEADWQGGRLAARFGLRRDPGVVTLATAWDHTGVAGHGQRLPLGVSVLVGPESGEAAQGLWVSSGAAIALRLASAGTTVVVDCGRLSVGSPVVPHVLPIASAVLVVVRNEPGDLAAAVSAVGRLRREHQPVMLVVAGESPYGAAEVEATLGTPVAAVLPWDPSAVAAVGSGAAHRNLRGSSWARAVRSLAERIAPTSLDGAAARGVA